MSSDLLVDVVARILALVPPWTRVYRVQRYDPFFDFDFSQMNGLFLMHNTTYRDIPLPLVTSGCENSGNLRELALNRMKDFGAVCRDVRFREVGVSACPFFFSILR